MNGKTTMTYHEFEDIFGIALGHPSIFFEKLKHICIKFKNFEHLVKILNRIELLGDRQISIHFQETITQKASAP